MSLIENLERIKKVEAIKLSILVSYNIVITKGGKNLVAL